VAILIDVPDDEVIRRLSGRRTCVKEGHIFHVEFDPRKNDDVCDICGARLEIRDDDKPEVVRKRLATYHEKTEPVVSYYEEHGILRRVDGSREPDDVNDRIRAMLATLKMEEELSAKPGAIWRRDHQEDPRADRAHGCVGRHPGALPAHAPLQVPPRRHHL